MRRRDRQPPPASEIPETLSPSSVNTFADCSLKWFYKKVLKLPEQRGAALGLGTAVDAAIMANFEQKIETKKDLDVSGVQAVFTGALIEQLDTGVVLQKDESADDLKQAGEVMTRIYMERAAPTVDPAAVQVHVEGLIGEVSVQGYIDVLTTDGKIIDIKTAKTHRGITPAHKLQGATYEMLEPTASGVFQLSTLTKTKTVTLHQDTITITPEDRKLTTNMYSITREQMQTGLVAPNRSSFLCSRRYCGFWQRCCEEYGGTVEL